MENKSIMENNEYAIEVIDVKKTFKSYQDKASSFKERFLHPSRTKHEDVQVLKGISFQVKYGEAIGIIGKNGCGKSTTLKLLTRILYPNEGEIKIKGRVSSLIELGAGFHPDMTGRENIYTNASIFGITRKEVDKRLDDIIRFSELEEYIDNPVRTYSSGMYMRLAFAVAINVDADVLLIDEILAVGDAAFQKKCFEKLKEIKANGTTIVIVSHSMDQMYKICDRLIWIDKGLIKKEGVPKFIGEEYLDSMEGRRIERIEEEKELKKKELEGKIQAEKGYSSGEEEELKELERQKKILEKNETLKTICDFCQPTARREGEGKIQYSRVELKNEAGEITVDIKTGEKCSIILSYTSSIEVKDIRFVIGITREDGVYCYGTGIDRNGNIEKQGTMRFDFVNKLLPGNYVLDLWIETLPGEAYDSIFGLMPIRVTSDSGMEKGILSMEYEWEIEK